MKKIIFGILILYLLQSSNASLVFANNTSIEKNHDLCKEQEEVIFSCTFNNKKLVSLCESKNESLTSSYMKYRYGSLNSPFDIEYPMSNFVAQKAFNFSKTESSAQARTEEISFSLTKYLYVLAITYRSRTYSEAVLSVFEKKSKTEIMMKLPVFQRTCDDIKINNNFWILNSNNLFKLSNSVPKTLKIEQLTNTGL